MHHLRRGDVQMGDILLTTLTNYFFHCYQKTDFRCYSVCKTIDGQESYQTISRDFALALDWYFC